MPNQPKHPSKIQNSWKNYLKFYLPPVLWAFVIYFASSQSHLPGLAVSGYDFLLKKSAHIFVYAVFYWLIHRALNFRKPGHKWNWWIAFLIILLYAATDEFHQSFTPTRTPTIRDIGYDFIGATIAFLRIYRYI